MLRSNISGVDRVAMADHPEYLEELQSAIRRLHGVESEYMGSVLVKGVLQGNRAWEGLVEVFDLVGHPTAFRVYAWAHDTDDPESPRRQVVVLHSHPIKSAHDAVRAAITAECRGLKPAE